MYKRWFLQTIFTSLFFISACTSSNTLSNSSISKSNIEIIKESFDVNFINNYEELISQSEFIACGTVENLSTYIENPSTLTNLDINIKEVLKGYLKDKNNWELKIESWECRGSPGGCPEFI